MKSAEEMALEVFSRRDEHLKKEARYKSIYSKVAVMVLSVAIIGTIGMGCAFASGLDIGGVFGSIFASLFNSPLSENQADYVENHVSSIGESVAQNGVTATLEGALTDGTTAFILIDIAAPDGQNIEALPLGFDIEFDKLKLEGQENEHISSISATCFMIDDNDGKENTASMLIQYNVYQLLDSNFSLADGKNRTLRLRDLFYHEKEYPYSRCTVAEGEWAFEFAFTPVDTEEVELLNESISASYTQISGKHVEAEITSVLMKGLSASVYYRLAPHEIQEAGDFGILEFVMKDGRVIEAYPKKAGQTVQIDNGDIVPDTRCHYCTYVFSAPIDHADVAELHIGENVIAVNAQ